MRSVSRPRGFSDYRHLVPLFKAIGRLGGWGCHRARSGFLKKKKEKKKRPARNHCCHASKPRVWYFILFLFVLPCHIPVQPSPVPFKTSCLVVENGPHTISCFFSSTIHLRPYKPVYCFIFFVSRQAGFSFSQLRFRPSFQQLANTTLIHHAARRSHQHRIPLLPGKSLVVR